MGQKVSSVLFNRQSAFDAKIQLLCLILKLLHYTDNPIITDGIPAAFFQPRR